MTLGISMTVTKFVKDFRITDSVARMIYNTVLFPTMTFGLKGTALTKANRVKLRRYETQILRSLRRHSKSTARYSTVSKYLSGKTVMRRLRVYKASYFAHILRRPRTHLLQHAYRYKASYKKHGRPCITWLDNLAQDRKKYNFSEGEWNEAAKKKNCLKQLAETIYTECQNDSTGDEYFSDYDCSDSNE